MGCGQGGNQKKDIFGLVWISSEVCKIPEVETHNAWINRLAKRRLHKKIEWPANKVLEVGLWVSYIFGLKQKFWRESVGYRKSKVVSKN